jgi:hypothetical protein
LIIPATQLTVTLVPSEQFPYSHVVALGSTLHACPRFGGVVPQLFGGGKQFQFGHPTSGQARQRQ